MASKFLNPAKALTIAAALLGGASVREAAGAYGRDGDGGKSRAAATTIKAQLEAGRYEFMAAPDGGRELGVGGAKRAKGAISHATLRDRLVRHLAVMLLRGDVVEVTVDGRRTWARPDKRKESAPVEVAPELAELDAEAAAAAFWRAVELADELRAVPVPVSSPRGRVALARGRRGAWLARALRVRLEWRLAPRAWRRVARPAELRRASPCPDCLLTTCETWAGGTGEACDGAPELGAQELDAQELDGEGIELAGLVELDAMRGEHFDGAAAPF